jgi:hypothetical protein
MKIGLSWVNSTVTKVSKVLSFTYEFWWNSTCFEMDVAGMLPTKTQRLLLASYT